MIARLSLPLLLIAACAFSPSADAEFASYAEQHKLAPLYPARPNFSSGTVFRIQRSADGSRYVRVLCRNLFAGVAADRTSVALESTMYSDPERFNEALGVIYGLLFSAKQAEENLQAQKVRAIKLSYGEAAIEKLPSTIALSETGSTLPLDPACLAVLTKLKSEESFEAVHVVDRALFVKRFGVEVERPRESTVDVIEMLGVDSDHKFESKGMNSVEIEAPYYIGMNSLSIVDIGLPESGGKPNMRVVKTGPAKLPERFRAWE